jgi:GNAT superfamily N-acetyltransferase
VAYYTLMPYIIEREALGTGQGRGLPDRIPGYLIARLALHQELHGNRIGSQVLASALTRAATAAAKDIGGRYVVVDVIDATAASFYRHHGFEPIPTNNQRLLIPTKSLESYLP